jgi:hypothetical protein
VGLGQTVPSEDVTEALPRAPQDLVELQLRQSQRLSNFRPRLFTQVVPFQHFTVALLRQMSDEVADTLRQLLLAETLFNGQSLVLEIRNQLTVAVMLPCKLPAPVGSSELASRAIEIAPHVARVFQSLSANFRDRTLERTLQQVLSRIAIDTSLKEYLQQGPPISHVKLILKRRSFGNGHYEAQILALTPHGLCSANVCRR